MGSEKKKALNVFLYTCKTKGEAFIRESLRNSHFVQIKKVGEGGVTLGEGGGGIIGGGGGRVMDIPQDEVGHCSPSLVKRTF